MKVYVDKTHSLNHTQQCQEQYSAYNCEEIDGVITQACEIFFNCLSGFRFIVKHMNKTRFNFFTLVFLWLRNKQNERRLMNSGLFKCKQDTS